MIENNDIRLDTMFRLSLAADICQVILKHIQDKNKMIKYCPSSGERLWNVLVVTKS